MTKKEAMDRWLAGETLMLAEWRSGGAEVIAYRSKKDGTAQSFAVTKHNVEFGDTSVIMSERIELDIAATDQQKAAACAAVNARIKAQYKKGQRVVIELQGLAIERGVIQGKGIVSVLEG